MAQRTDTFDLAPLRLATGQGERLDLHVALGGLDMGGERYEATEALTPVTLDVAKMSGGGHSMRMRFEVALSGPCMRCLEPARPSFAVDAREISKPGEGDELDSPYLTGDELNVERWARDALVLALPAAVLCRLDCAGLCPECGVNLNEAGPEHHHEQPPDKRWDKLSELKFD
jgi:uncharacterized protein